MLKNISKLECKIILDRDGEKVEKVYEFFCDMDSPLAHVKEALFQFCKYIGQIEDNIKQQKILEDQKKLEKIEEKPEDVNVS